MALRATISSLNKANEDPCAHLIQPAFNASQRGRRLLDRRAKTGGVKRVGVSALAVVKDLL